MITSETVPLTSRKKIQNGSILPPKEKTKSPLKNMYSFWLRFMRISIGIATLILAWKFWPRFDEAVYTEPEMKLQDQKKQEPSDLVSTIRNVSSDYIDTKLKDYKKELQSHIKEMNRNDPSVAEAKIEALTRELQELKKILPSGKASMEEDKLNVKLQETIKNLNETQNSNDWAVESIGTSVTLFESQMYDVQGATSSLFDRLVNIFSNTPQSLFRPEILLKTPKQDADIGECLALPASGGSVDIHLPLSITIDKITLQYLPAAARLTHHVSAPKYVLAEVFDVEINEPENKKRSKDGSWLGGLDNDMGKRLKVKEVMRRDLKWKAALEILPMHSVRGNTVRLTMRDPVDQNLEFTCLYRVKISSSHQT